MNDSARKSIKKYTAVEEQKLESMRQRDKINETLNHSLKVRKTLELMCTSILDKNYNMYLRHEKMLDEEREKRQALAADFQQRMQGVTRSIEEIKEERQKELDANNDIRRKIQEEVAAYKVHEEKYQKEMGVHQQKMQGIEQQFKA